MEDIKWSRFIVSSLDYAFQPIVSIHTGICFAHEALLRNYERLGYESIHALFDAAHDEGMLFKVDSWLKEKAIEKFARIEGHERLKLFFNLDNRVLDLPEYSIDPTSETLKRFGLHPDAMCFELSEKHDFIAFTARNSLFDHFKRHAYKVAIDDFGTGFSGLQLLYHAEPDFLKIDRFFIASIETDSKKRLFVSNVVNLAHILGIAVIAEGVETEKEYYACKQIGCDFVQGFLVQRPTVDVRALRIDYEEISLLNAKDARGKVPDRHLIFERLERITPLPLYEKDSGTFTSMPSVFEAFRTNRANTFFPVVNTLDEPIGLVREKEIKEFVYSKYGKDLLMNRSFGKTLKDFVVRCPVVDIGTKLEKILETFAVEENSEGAMLVESGRYIGFLSTRSLLNALNEKNLKVARDQNPLTKLPGNNLINEYIDQMLASTDRVYVLAYYDLDNFKPFNDRYGFRQGDRAILLFADILKEASSTHRCFVGHIGGDDFFTAFDGEHLDIERAHETIESAVRKFARDAISLYDKEDRQRGFIITTDREGKERRFPLLSVSAVVLTLSSGERDVSLYKLGKLLARLKKEAKASPDRIVYWTTEDGRPRIVSTKGPT